MRQAYAHQAILTLPPGSDDQAPAHAVTAVLAGATHHTTITRSGDEARLRILFTAAPHRAEELRAEIDRVLTAETVRWQTTESGCARVGREDHAEGRRLLQA
jgi:hypothetical protein